MKPRTTSGKRTVQLWHREVPGPLWDGRHLVARRQIAAYGKVVAREFRPKKIILFGSYAYGKPTRDSDVDLVVVMPFRGRDVRMMGEIRVRVGAPFTCWSGLPSERGRWITSRGKCSLTAR